MRPFSFWESGARDYLCAQAFGPRHTQSARNRATFLQVLFGVRTVSAEPPVETADPSGAEPVTKKQKGRRSEAASRRLQAAGHKLKQVFLSG